MRQEPRNLAPVYESLPDAIEAMRQAAKDGSFFQYRRVTNTRKHSSIDITSCSAAVQTWDALKPETREKYLAKFGHDPHRFCMMAWSAIGRSKS